MEREKDVIPFLETRPEGLYASAFEACLDPAVPVPRAILTHAHADHASSGHGEIWGTPQTLAIYRRRNPEWAGHTRAIPLGESVRADGVSLQLVPAGHVLGAAQFYFQSGDGSLLYTGDFKRRPGRTTPPAAAPPAQVLIIESTFGLPVFRFPPPEKVEERLVATCRAAIQNGKVPVLLAYAFGKSQEAVAILTQAQIPTVLHGAAWKLLPEYEAAGFSFPLSRPYESGPVGVGEVLVVPPNCARTPVVQKVKKRVTVLLSGWALREASRADFDADVLLPMSDHADFPELLAHVAEVSPRLVVAQHGYADDFARILSARGVEAFSLEGAPERLAPES